MNQRTRLILTGVVVVLVCFLLFFFFVNPQREELANVRAQIAAEQTRTAQLQAELARLKALQANASELEAELTTIRRFVPTRPDLANFIFQVQEAANAAGLDFVQITPELPKPPPEGAALAQVRATIGANGGYFSLQDFLRRLHGMDRALRVDNMSINVLSTQSGSTRLGMIIAARIFYELPEIATAPAPAPAPGAPTPTPTPTPTP